MRSAVLRWRRSERVQKGRVSERIEPSSLPTDASTAMSKSAANLNPKTTHFEFWGPPGAFGVSVIVPLTTYLLYFGCSEQAGGCPPSLWLAPTWISNAVTNKDWWLSLFDAKATIAYLAWYAYTVVCWAAIPGDWVDGVTLRDGTKKKYKINAFSTFLLTMGLVSGWILTFGPQSFTFFNDHFLGLSTAAFMMSLAQAFYVYAASFGEGKMLALGGNSGNFLYDWFIGRELNPSIGPFDIKYFNELRPGLILWVLIDISMACEQAVRRGGFSKVTDSMWLVLAFQIYYVIDGLYNEPAILTTMDITTDGFGFMLSVGDLLWVPFFYSLQTRYLAFKQVELGPIWTAAIFGVNALGLYIFRASNGEKNDFRNGRNPKGLKSFKTQRGTQLLTSGWWGSSRHPNYFGDLIMGLAWCMPTGLNTLITYFYFFYFVTLLVHRQYRDDENCAQKYGKDWDTYKKLVPYKIVPYVY